MVRRSEPLYAAVSRRACHGQPILVSETDEQKILYLVFVVLLQNTSFLGHNFAPPCTRIRYRTGVSTVDTASDLHDMTIEVQNQLSLTHRLTMRTDFCVLSDGAVTLAALLAWQLLLALQERLLGHLMTQQ